MLFLDYVIQVSIVLGIALMTTPLLKRYSAGLRHAVLSAAVLGAALLPVLTAVTPWEWGVITAQRSETEPSIQNSIASESSSEPQTNDSSLLVSEAEPAPGFRDSTAFPLDPRRVLIAIWILGMGVNLSVVLVGVLRLKRIARRASPLDHGRWIRIRDEIAGRYGLRRPLTLLESTDLSILVTWGVIRPRIVVPKGASAWGEDRVRMVLGHEMAHVQRSDWLMQMVAELLRCVHWFNPLAWYACRRLRQEGEQASDDAVFRLGIAPSEYAGHLVDLARNLQSPGRIASLALAMAGSSSLERRIDVMLNSTISHSAVTKFAVVATVIVSLGLVLPVAGLRASVQDQSSTSPALVPLPAPAMVRTEVLPLSAPQPAPAIARAEVVPLPAPTTVPAEVSAVRAPIQEEPASSIRGVVLDVTGARVPGAYVVLESDAATIGRVSNASGEYRIPDVPPGEYTLVAELPGFGTHRQEVVIEEGNELLRDVLLSIGAVATVVAVVSDRLPPEESVEPPDPARRILGVTAGVQRGRIINQVVPVYPRQLRSEGVEGMVVLEGMIGKDGVVQGLKVVSTDHADLAMAALDAVREWRYEPSQLNGEPVAVTTTISVMFGLN